MYNILLKTREGKKIFGCKEKNPFWRGGRKFKYILRIGEEKYYTDDLPDSRYFEEIAPGEFTLKKEVHIAWVGGTGYLRNSEPNQFWFEKLRYNEWIIKEKLL
jgi:hypothetical protein